MPEEVFVAEKHMHALCEACDCNEGAKFPRRDAQQGTFFNLFDDCPHAERHIQGQQVEPLRHAKPRLSINE